MLNLCSHHGYGHDLVFEGNSQAPCPLCDVKAELDDVRAQLHDMEEKNSSLIDKIGEVEEERDSLVIQNTNLKERLERYEP